ncbi:MAG: histidine kinase dimerization/phospho-acceptor domain-containing protein [Actinoallomurus sp.]
MHQPPAGTPLRRRLLVALVGIATLATVLFALPLAVVVQRLDHSEAVTALERDATRIAAVVPEDEVTRPGPVDPPAGLAAGLTVGIYRSGGRRVAGAGPGDSPVAAAARDGRVHEGVEGGDLAVAAPIPSDDAEGVTVMSRVSLPYDQVTDQVERAWLLMSALAAFVVILATVYARYQSGRLAAPLERLTAAAQALGDGDFSVRARRSGLREADAAGRALEITARRLGEVLDRERAFSADVSHQLRTPLTGLLLGLESALGRPDADPRAAIRTAVERGRHLQSIIDDLLRLARDGQGPREVLDVPGLLSSLRGRWEGTLAARRRLLSVTCHEPLPEVRSAPSVILQILEVLVDNAATHGRGDISVEAVDLGAALSIEVSDRGPGIEAGRDVFARRASSGEGHGIGLFLARSLAEAEGGRLLLRSPAPPVFALLLPGTGS